MHSKEPEFSENDIPDLSGYVTIVTGGNSGIGYETANQLALHNARVYIASRSQERVNQAIGQMSQAAMGKTLDLHFLQIDLQDLKSVKAAAEHFMTLETRLDILINNAGVMTVPFKLTADGLETQWQVNYVSPHIFTSSLMPLLLSTASTLDTKDRVRVVHVSSDAAFFGPDTVQWNDVNMTSTKGVMELWKRYGHSKQAIIRDAKELNDRYSSQGIVKSNLQGHDPTLMGKVVRVAMKLGAGDTPLHGALNSLYCATSPSAPVQGQGRFFVPVGKPDSLTSRLKCDRGHPCDNCAKRNQSQSCQYTNPAVRNRTAQARRVTYSSDIAERNQSTNAGTIRVAVPDDHGGLSQEIGTPGTMHGDQMGTRWFDDTHWQAIMDDIAELKGCTDTQSRGDPLPDTVEEENYGLTLFFGLSQSMNRPDLLASLPSRPVVDRLVSRYFNTKEPILMVLHTPTFYREYTQFWENQQAAPVAWISLLFNILCYSVSFYQRAGDALPGSLGEPRRARDRFRTRAAQCLVLADYTRPGRYKVEALLLYSGTEFMRTRDSQIGISILFGVIVKLAMHMGYHRNSKHYQNLSVFEGEMRRRAWALIWQVDHLVSFQVGLPRTISDSQCDAGLPHNLVDEDFDETTKVLPTPRPITERTPVTYTIMKGRLVSVFARIVENPNLTGGAMHEDVTQLDKHLQDAHISLPPVLRIRTMNMSITDPPDLIMQRYNLELLYQKARCVLHRRYLTDYRSDLRYAYSRWSCVDAATQIIRHQSDLYDETLPGGQLYKDRWYISSLTSHDFLLAAMVLCLELSWKTTSDPPNLYPGSMSSTPKSREELSKILETSYSIWTAFSETSTEARKASRALALMLQSAKRNRPGSRDMGEEPVRDQRPRLRHINHDARHLPLENSQPQMFLPSETQAEPDLSGMAEQTSMAIEDMMNNPEGFDWNAWDNQIQHNSWELTDETWMASLAPSDSQLSMFSPTD
ncbi:short chain dehydrogenase domain-containing protein [Trichoderma breve]|uniref:Short chain dehydrogenase domain-containing protein n=1 Tax=Trichoderma breve TaxID=2034170 RepID=A0A9W9B861_9HYPO|nr:short chain dehydrogenase domain-containing protein [Trichoderma breve]KAJ4854771.1 short chain dehydrogenase domain-containing protein [Trichoderma breve]